jgi:acetyl esterase/lipase
VENSIQFAQSLRNAGVPFALHLYERGPHGIGLGSTNSASYHPWTQNCMFWLKERQFAR